MTPLSAPELDHLMLCEVCKRPLDPDCRCLRTEPPNPRDRAARAPDAVVLRRRQELTNEETR